MEFVELKTVAEREASYRLLKELAPELNKADYLQALNHEILKTHKLFGLKVSGQLVSVAAAWVLMNGLLEKFLWIYGFVTTASLRSQGYGKELLAELESYARRENFDEIRVHAHRGKAIAFWEEKAGFESFSSVFRKKV